MVAEETKEDKRDSRDEQQCLPLAAGERHPRSQKADHDYISRSISLFLLVLSFFTVGTFRDVPFSRVSLHRDLSLSLPLTFLLPLALSSLPFSQKYDKSLLQRELTSLF